MFEANVSQIGLLPADLAGEVAGFYSHSRINRSGSKAENGYFQRNSSHSGASEHGKVRRGQTGTSLINTLDLKHANLCVRVGKFSRFVHQKG